jgi:site-specific recombinase XerD
MKSTTIRITVLTYWIKMQKRYIPEEIEPLVEKLRQRCKTENTYMSYERALIQFYFWCDSNYGNRHFELNQQNIEDFVEYLKNDRKEPQTINTYANGLKKAAAINGNGYIKITNIPKITRKLPEILSEDEINTLVEKIPDIRDKAVIALLYDCALRLSELRNLNMNDVDLDKRRINIERRKNSGTPQILPFTERTKEILIDYLNEREERGYPKDLEPFFVGSRARITVYDIEALVKGWSRKLIGKNITPHSLRHSRAIHLRRKGILIEMIKDILGHKDLKTTLFYARSEPKDLEAFDLRW